MHWRTYLDSDVIRYVDLDGRDFVVQIARVKKGKVTGKGGKSSGKAMLWFEGRTKPLGCGAEILTQISNLYGNDTKLWAGKWITIWPDPSVKYGGERVGGVRVRSTQPSEADITAAQAALKAQPPAEQGAA